MFVFDFFTKSEINSICLQLLKARLFDYGFLKNIVIKRF